MALSLSQIETRVRQLQGALGGLQFRIGYVDAGGVVYLAEGVSGTRNTTGDYTLTFDPPFKTNARVVAMVGQVAAVRSIKQYVGSASTPSSFRLATYDPSTGAAGDSDFWFVAAG